VLAGVRCTTPGGALASVPSPFAGVRVETDKGRPPIDGVAPVVARLDDAHATRLLEAPDETVLAAALPALGAALVASSPEPAWVQVKRWRYAVPTGRLDGPSLNPPGTRIVLAGDSLTGASLGGDDHAAVFASGLVAVGAAEAGLRFR
jgi:predicted NAD/FAD-dependent oxidoreductase